MLLDEQLRAKVSDFGLSRPYDYRMTLRPGNRFYMAPELLLGTSMYVLVVVIVVVVVVAVFAGQHTDPGITIVLPFSVL